jgi:hypothetical protein
MNGDTPAVHVCKDPRPTSAEARLAAAMEAVDLALTCVDLRKVRWTPVASDAWERAVTGLNKVRQELAAALTAWRSHRKET